MAKWRLILAKKGGFCMGVKRAVDIVLAEAERADGVIYTDGPLIHNPQAVEVLKAKRVYPLSDLAQAKGKRVIIRTHGISPRRRKKLEELGANICDATCPRVSRIHKIIREHAEKGCTVVIIGDKGHPEVAGLLGSARGRGVVVEEEADFASLPNKGETKLCIVAQSTQSRERFHHLVKKIKERYPDAEIFDTLCNSTAERQEEVRKIAGEADVVIVVGGRNSANTKRLFEIVKEEGKPAYLVETEEEITEAMVTPFSAIGIAAGASTPKWMIERVVNRVREIKLRQLSPLLAAFLFFLRFLTKGNLYTAIGVFFLTYGSARLLGIEPSFTSTAIASLYILSIHLLNYYTDPEGLRLLGQISEASYYIRYRTPLLATALISALSSLVLALTKGGLTFLLLLAAIFLGILYGIRILPPSISRILKFGRLKDIPTSKDIFASLGWGTVVVLLPVIGSRNKLFSPALLFTFLYVALLAAIRSIMFDIKNIRADRITGRETIPSTIGEKKTKSLLIFLLLLASLDLLLYFALFGNFLALVLLIPLGYASLYLFLHQRGLLRRDIVFSLVVDGKFYLVGILAYLLGGGS
ncbi:MAG: 4-hydroxy-3-methylbut-2-enyl diphosphate reductase [Acidobacteria bacterium]|nr:4-hydroxy-3-methylbut-2-enyl diphosphate reductase [Acidobacteriota bacterium]